MPFHGSASLDAVPVHGSAPLAWVLFQKRPLTHTALDTLGTQKGF